MTDSLRRGRTKNSGLSRADLASFVHHIRNVNQVLDLSISVCVSHALSPFLNTLFLRGHVAIFQESVALLVSLSGSSRLGASHVRIYWMRPIHRRLTEPPRKVVFLSWLLFWLRFLL